MRIPEHSAHVKLRYAKMSRSAIPYLPPTNCRFPAESFSKVEKGFSCESNQVQRIWMEILDVLKCLSVSILTVKTPARRCMLTL